MGGRGGGGWGTPLLSLCLPAVKGNVNHLLNYRGSNIIYHQALRAKRTPPGGGAVLLGWLLVIWLLVIG